MAENPRTESARDHEPVVRIELPVGAGFDGTFTTGDAQTYAVLLLDAVCTAFDGVGLSGEGLATGAKSREGSFDVSGTLPTGQTPPRQKGLIGTRR